MMKNKNVLKSFVILFLLLVVLSSCKKDNSVEPYNYERDTPAWLKAKIDSISTNHFYHGSKVYRHIWHNNYTYYFFIPLSSCMYCEVYYANGDKIKFTDTNMGQDYVNNRKAEVLIWEWKE